METLVSLPTADGAPGSRPSQEKVKQGGSTWSRRAVCHQRVVSPSQLDNEQRCWSSLKHPRPLQRWTAAGRPG